ncbi:MAG TPA: hypothetical protein DCF33_11005 [Saprospirales bacterium]|nr:hypothetical protein [Saprospirales bacterium]
MKTHFHLLTALLISLLLANQAFAQSGLEAKPRRQPIREVTLTGTGYELGLQHGQIFKKEIGELVVKLKENTAKVLGKDANEVLADFHQKTSFDAAIKQWTPALYEEVRGIADGAGQSFNDVMVFSLLDEFWVYQDNLENHHCSGMGVPARNGQPAYIAQNMDIEAYTDGYQVLLRIARYGDRPEQLILTHPGCIALNGMNETGIGACMNTLMQLKANSTGLPVAFIVRGILASTDKDDLLHFVQNVPHASGQNYIIGIREEVYDFEASANKVIRFDPKNENGTVWHTNHPLVNDDVKEWFKKYDPNLKPEDKPVNSNSFVRLAAVQRRVTPSGSIGDAAIKEALRSKDDAKYPVCVTPNEWGMTFGSVIMTLTDKPFLQITSGPPDESEYKRVEFSDKPFQNEPSSIHYYTQGNANRTAAEWEPAKGTLVAWPLALPHKLVVELAKDNHLYTLVENDTIRAEAQKWYNQWGIEASHNTFVYVPRGIDFWWTRDWGPSAIFMPDGKMKLADANCLYVPPRAKWGCTDALYSLFSDKQHETLESEIDDNTIVPLGKGLNLEVLNLPFINTGGNFMTDGLGTAFSTCIMVNENKFHQVPEAQYFKLNQDLQGINNYHINSNFEKMGIQHIDCFMKLLDEERILVAEPPVNHELHAVYEKIIENELKKLKTVYGRPYEILRLKTDRYDGAKLAAYTNSIIVNKTIYVPLFQIKADSIALQTWRNAMPGYVVKGFEFALKDEPIISDDLKDHYKEYGWKSGDALHCRTRAVWDSEMLFITVKRLPAKVAPNASLIVYATIIDYSKKGLEPDSQKLHWRIKGEQNWNEEPLNSTDGNTHFNATIPAKATHKTIEYYISAASKSGSRETMPRTAPGGFYTVTW